MLDPTPSQSTLYGRTEGSSTLSLRFLRCGRCEALSFPASVYGCQHCGAPADEGKVEVRPGHGILHNFVTVYADLSPAAKAPYIVGEVELAPGLIEESILTVTSEAELTPGMELHAVAVPDPQLSDQFLCRFAPRDVGAPAFNKDPVL